MSPRDGLATILTLVSWLAVTIALVTGVVAVLRLRRSGAGLVIGGSLALMAFASVSFRLYRTVAMPDHLESANVPLFFVLRLLVDAIHIGALVALIVALFVYPSVLSRSPR